MAEGAFRAAAQAVGLGEKINIDSAGTIGYHAGSPPDHRAVEAAGRHGVDISGQQSRKVLDKDFETYDYIMVMDRENLSDLRDRCPENMQDRIQLFLTFAAGIPLDEMPDPYYGPANQFDTCYAAAMNAAAGLLDHIRERHF